MRGILPDKIRLRSGKGGGGARAYWGLNEEHSTIRQLLKEPILADLGVIDPKLLKRALRHAREGRRGLYLPVLSILALETWLRVRSKLWRNLESGDDSRLVVAS
jgi:hypothetical protein